MINFKIHGGEFGAKRQKRMSKREKEKYGKRKNDKKEKIMSVPCHFDRRAKPGVEKSAAESEGAP